MGTWIVGLVVIGVVALAGYRVYKNRKNGKSCNSDCGRDCEGCRKSEN